MSGLTMIHNWFPDPYLTKRLVKPALENAETMFWNTPFRMMFVETSVDGFAAATYSVSGLPVGMDLTFAANIDTGNSTKDFAPLLVANSSFGFIAQSSSVHDIAMKMHVSFAVPSDGVVKLRFCAPPVGGESCTFSRVILTESASWDLVDGLVPTHVQGGVFGYDLMPITKD